MVWEGLEVFVRLFLRNDVEVSQIESIWISFARSGRGDIGIRLLDFLAPYLFLFLGVFFKDSKQYNIGDGFWAERLGNRSQVSLFPL